MRRRRSGALKPGLRRPAKVEDNGVTASGKAADKPARAEESRGSNSPCPFAAHGARRDRGRPASQADPVYQADRLNPLFGMEPPAWARVALLAHDACLLDQLDQLIETLDPVPASVLVDASALFAARPPRHLGTLETQPRETVA
jgi:hypothetical protein